MTRCGGWSLPGCSATRRAYAADITAWLAFCDRHPRLSAKDGAGPERPVVTPDDGPLPPPAARPGPARRRADRRVLHPASCPRQPSTPEPAAGLCPQPRCPHWRDPLAAAGRRQRQFPYRAHPRALTGLTPVGKRHRPPPSPAESQAARKARLFGIIRDDAARGMSIRQIAARRRVHRRMVRQALRPAAPQAGIPASTSYRPCPGHPGQAGRQAFHRLGDLDHGDRRARLRRLIRGRQGLRQEPPPAGPGASRPAVLTDL